MNNIKKSYGICLKQCEIFNRNFNKFEHLYEGDLIRILQTDSDQSDKVIIKLFDHDTNTFKTEVYECAKRDIDFIGDALWLYLIGPKLNQIRMKIYNERDLVLGLNCGSEITIKSFGNDANANIKGVVQLIDNVKEVGFGNFIGLLLQSMPHDDETYNNLLEKHHIPSISRYLLFRVEQLLDDLKYAAEQKRFVTRNMDIKPALPLCKIPEIIKMKMDAIKRASFKVDETIDIPVAHQFTNSKGSYISKVNQPKQLGNEYFNQSSYATNFENQGEVDKVRTMPNTNYYAPNRTTYASPSFEASLTQAAFNLDQLLIGATPTMPNTGNYGSNRKVTQVDMNKFDQLNNTPAWSNEYYPPNRSNYGTTGFDINHAEVGKVNTMPNDKYYVPIRNFSGSPVFTSRSEVYKHSSMYNTSNYAANRYQTQVDANKVDQFNNPMATGSSSYYLPKRNSHATTGFVNINTASATNPAQLENIKFKPVNTTMPNRPDSYTSIKNFSIIHDSNISAPRSGLESNHLTRNDLNQNTIYNANKNTFIPYQAEQKISSNMNGAVPKNDEPAALKNNKARNNPNKKNKKCNKRKNSIKCHLCKRGFGNDAICLQCSHCICIDCFRTKMFSLIGTNQVSCPFTTSNYSCQYKLQHFEVIELREKIDKFNILPPTVNPPTTTYDDSKDDEELFRCKSDRSNWIIPKSDSVNLFRYPVCEIYNCVHCKNIHENMTCKEYQEMLKAGVNSPNNLVGKIDDFVVSRFTGGGADRCSILDGAAKSDDKETLMKCAKRNCEGQWFILESNKNTLYKCPACGLYNCRKCNAIHQNQSCDEYQESKRYIPIMFRNIGIRSVGANKPDHRADNENTRILDNATDNHLQKRKWNCSHCTFENFSIGVICNMCGKKS